MACWSFLQNIRCAWLGGQSFWGGGFGLIRPGPICRLPPEEHQDFWQRVQVAAKSYFWQHAPQHFLMYREPVSGFLAKNGQTKTFAVCKLANRCHGFKQTVVLLLIAVYVCLCALKLHKVFACKCASYLLCTWIFYLIDQ